ncbi:hypothetical protein RJ639_026795 [Escallonia herrerae]|uniref:Myb-related protein 123 n=1 Tax=Escallonia herrerae TaxID=1293975 RepID=A0AA88XDP0_9ASTE|nr:hypothetical protein RJ639_026795 [Escallonia herrerae]
MERSPCCSKVGLNRGAWNASEDRMLTDYVKLHGEGRWRSLPKRAGLKRCGKSCRLRWLNYLRPDIKRGNISHDEEELIIRLHKLLGNRWSIIAGRLPGRTDNEVKNYWNTTLGKKVNEHRESYSTHKHSDLSSAKKDQKTESYHKSEMNVVRTKARRCSKAYFSPRQLEAEPMKINLMVGQSVLNKGSSTSNLVNEVGDNGGSSSLMTQENNQPNFMTDVEVGEFCFTEFSNTEFLNLFDTTCSGDLSSSSEGPVLFPREMLDNWTVNDYVQSDMSNYHFFSSIPETVGDWLA